MLRSNIFIAVSLFILNGLYAQNTLFRHELKVQIDPTNSFIKVSDQISPSSAGEELYFTLNSDLTITGSSDQVRIDKMDVDLQSKDFGMDRDDAGSSGHGVRLNKYKVFFKDETAVSNTFTIDYQGKISSPIQQSEENYQRGFSESPGIIDTVGVYLAGSSYWIPHFDAELMQFKMATTLPEHWKVVSQGKRLSSDLISGMRHEIWEENLPQEEIFLIAAKFDEYSFQAGNVAAMAFLRTPDEALANKYLETTAQYLEMYRQLVGPFPYAKFALVENFWETGYGMPSFTLLGEKVIRFPFILHSSYPHELLHNWWGNSVYVDFESGNWCEGITAYMADHLIKEQRGQGAEYRRSTLQKYTDYVTPENDFPLNAFLSRHNAASEAVGYGKSSMMFHMLRLMLGDEIFVKAFQHFNRENAFRKASFSDIQKSFETVSETDLSEFFNQWVNRKGAPKLSLQDVLFKDNEVRFSLLQEQEGDPFSLEVPVLIHTAEGLIWHKALMYQKFQHYSVKLNAPAFKIEVDPYFDLFRILDPHEVPASLSKAYGAGNTLLVLPSKLDETRIGMYNRFIGSWKAGNPGSFSMVKDSDLKELPKDKTVWILDFNNKFANNFFTSLEGHPVMNEPNQIALQGQKIDKVKQSSIITSMHPENPAEVLVFFHIHDDKAVAGLNRKLPHYGKYSFLAFEGEEPENVVKGNWEVINSPLTQKRELPGNAELRNTPLDDKTSAFLTRKALAELAPVFSAERMMKDIRFLSSQEMKGRGLGTAELRVAAEYIRDAFAKAGLKPGVDGQNFFQTWSRQFEGKGHLELTNVIGELPGTDPGLASQPLVISAHYDHLGIGWPDVRPGNEGKIHFGADDNASGIAVLLELARTVASGYQGARPVLFVAFTGEEGGLIGSRYFVKHYKSGGETPAFFANLNLDTNGRLFDQALQILGGSSAREWRFIFMGTEYVTGVKTALAAQDIDASDQVAFHESGVPAVQFFTGAHGDYHRPSDTFEQIDPPGLVKVASVAKEVLIYLGSRLDPMPFTGQQGGHPGIAAKEKPAGERRASTGTMPDFSFNGSGVRVAALTDGGPASKAGILVGDVIVAMNDVPVKSLKAYSDELKKYAPGEKVRIEVIRDDQKFLFELLLAER